MLSWESRVSHSYEVRVRALAGWMLLTVMHRVQHKQAPLHARSIGFRCRCSKTIR